MVFSEFKRVMQGHIDAMLAKSVAVFESDTDKDELWTLYLNSFPEGSNPIYRERREHDCSCCKQFVRSFGGVVAVGDDNAIVTIWDVVIDDGVYGAVAKAMSDHIKSKDIRGVFATGIPRFGVDKNHERLESGTVREWEHFFVEIPKHLMLEGSKTEGEAASEFNSTRQVFQRSLEEISRGSVEDVLDMIGQNNLYRGEEWHPALSRFLDLHKEYHGLPDDQKYAWCWKKTADVGGSIGKIRNHSIGVLLTNLSGGVDIEDAVKQYERIVAPSNYKRPKAVFSKRMVESAKQKVSELGMIDALGRRFATLDDITINNILFANRDAANRMGGGDVFEELEASAVVSPKHYDRAREVTAEQFVEESLPSARSVELLLENRHAGNLVSLIAPKVANSKSMFKWNNNFSWAYAGNIADSMKARVRFLGGNVEGVLRFSIQWNEDGDNQNDFDAHCVEPGGNEIYFARPSNGATTGCLDVDIRHPRRQIGNKTAVENITWTDINRMRDGQYRFYVHNYKHRGGRSGFSAEIEFGGEAFSFEYGKELRHGEVVDVAVIEFNKQKGIRFIKNLPTSTTPKKVWNIDTNRFHPVTVCMFSPNYWDGQKGVGNRHYFFMMKGCVSDSQPNGFFNEFLKEELMPHKRVFEALGSKMKVDPAEDQLSGVGFSSTKRNSLICKVDGAAVKVNF